MNYLQKKIVLVIPPYDLFKEGYGTRIRIRSGYLPPLGAGYVASFLLKAGIAVEIIDAPAEHLSEQRTVERIRNSGAQLVGISAMTSSAPSAYSLATSIKKHTGLPVIIGGPHASCFPEEILSRCPAIDLVVIDEGELTARELMQDEVFRALGTISSPVGNQEKNNAVEVLKKVKGICFRCPTSGESQEVSGNFETGKQFIRTPPRPAIKYLDAIPPPARELYPNHLYSPLPNQYRVLPATSMITSRGCTWRKCAFCYQAGSHALSYRRHSPARVVNEILELVHLYGIREISFWDDNFLVGTDWLVEFSRLLAEAGKPVLFSCYGRVDTMREEHLAVLSRVGLWSIFLGLETGSQELLDRIKKGTTIEQGRRAVAWAKKYGIETRGSFMLALPGETPELAMKTIEFAIELDLDYAQFLPAHPEKGTELYSIALRSGNIRPYRGRTRATYVPEGYSGPAEVEKMVHRAYRSFYLRPSYFLKTLKKIRSFQDFKKYFEGFLFMAGLWI